jgi:glutamate N-acetyltransferase/amino-acid N-acetyltransferase
MKSQEYSMIDGGVTAPQGFTAAGVAAGIKATGLDLALLKADRPAAVAGTFTTNKVQAAPVKLCRTRIASGQAQAIVINSGSANACTGPQGMVDAEAMGAAAAGALDVPEAAVLVCSTGTIGKPLPLDKIKPGIQAAAAALSDAGGDDAAHAIMTTDTVAKQVAVQLSIDGKTVRIGGMTKGAGMIDPNMATMLAFLTTDAVVIPGALQNCLSDAVHQSFNSISVDGDQSTNDTVLCLANGAAGNSPLDASHPEWNLFVEALTEVAKQLAMKIVQDGEGATKYVAVTVSGAISIEDAQKAARAVANSLLVKTSWFGGDPNWGRIIAAVGYSGAEVKEDLVDISYDGLVMVKGGQRSADTPLSRLEEILAQPSFAVDINLNLGDDTDTVYTCDCSHEYVTINSEYMT